MNNAMPKKFIDKQFVRFLLVGLINMLFGYLVFALFIFLKFHYSIAAFLGTVVGVIFNFKTTGRLVFQCSDNRLIVKFFMVYGVVYVLNLLGLLLFNVQHINNYIAGAVLLLPLGIVAFVLNKRFVFR